MLVHVVERRSRVLNGEIAQGIKRECTPLFLRSLLSLACAFTQLIDSAWLGEEQRILARQKLAGVVAVAIGLLQAAQKRSPAFPVIWRAVVLVNCVPLAKNSQHCPLDNCLRVQSRLPFNAALCKR